MRLLLEDGAFAKGNGAVVGAPPHGAVTLSRALCRFKLYRAAPGLSRTQIARAAHTFVEAHVPFADTGVFLLWSPHGAEIWYWDKAQIAAAAGAAPLKVSGPESLFREPGEGWRILACVEGYEAQYWEHGGLVASTWRRQAFSPQQWAAFVLGVEASVYEPPEAPPTPTRLQLLTQARWRRRQIKPPPTWQGAETMAISVALCAAGLAAFFMGQALHYESNARAHAREAAAIEASIASDPALRRARERTQLLADFSSASSVGDAIAAVADALTVFKTFGVTAESWRADQAGFRATLNVSITDIPLREVVAGLEATPLLCGVEPNLSSREGALEITASLERAGGQCGNDGGRGG